MKTQKAQLREMLERIIEAFDDTDDIHGSEFEDYRVKLLIEAKELLRHT